MSGIFSFGVKLLKFVDYKNFWVFITFSHSYTFIIIFTYVNSSTYNSKVSPSDKRSLSLFFSFVFIELTSGLVSSSDGRYSSLSSEISSQLNEKLIPLQ